MKKLFLFTLLCSGFFQLQAQLQPHACATPHGRHPWWDQYQRNREAYNRAAQERAGGTMLYLPTTLHIVCNDDGSGHASVITVLEALCQANIDYKPADFHYFIEFPIDFIHNSAFNSHDTILDGGTFALQYKTPNTYNPFFVADPAGACGYVSRYSGSVMVSYNCLGGHTLAHELGHDMLLEHPFYGWEGGISHDNTIPADFTQPAPFYVYSDYSVYNTFAGPSVVDTNEVEIVDRTGVNANCYTAADGFCDTDADYIAYRWQCDANGESSETQIDPLGTVFKSKGEWIMSYSSDGCQTGFSPEQILAMQAFVQAERQSFLGNQNPILDTIMQTANLVQPANGEVVSAFSRQFRWNSVPGATHYVLEITNASGNYGAGQLSETVITTDTTFLSTTYYSPRAAFFPYGWRVKPFNQGNTCAPISANFPFNTSTALSSIDQLAPLTDFTVYPNPIAGGQSLFLEWSATQETVAEVRLLTITGQTVLTANYSISTGSQQIELKTNALLQGVYLLEVRTAEGYATNKIVVR